MSEAVEVEDEVAAKLAVLREAAREAIVRCKIDLRLNEPFYGALITHLDLVEATDQIKTAATDGVRVYYNIHFVLSMTKDQLKFLLKHELHHILQGHLLRIGERDKDRWNVACDFLINYDLLEEMNQGSLATGASKMPPGGCFDERFSPYEMTSEELYDHLTENENSYDLNTMDEMLGGGGDEQGDGTELTISDQTGSMVTRAEMEEVTDTLREATRQAAQIAQAANHTVPRNFRHLISELTTPKMNWRTLLDAHIRSQVKGRRSYRRPSRRAISIHGQTGQYLPFTISDFDKTIDIWVALDDSGSMSAEQLRDLLSEIVGISKTFSKPTINIFCFNDHVHTHKTYSRDNVDTINEYPLSEDSGGTIFPCIFDFLKQKKVVPRRLVVFTDGLPNTGWGDPDYCPTLFVIHSDPRQAIVPPFGQVAYYTLDT